MQDVKPSFQLSKFPQNDSVFFHALVKEREKERVEKIDVIIVNKELLITK